MNCAFSKLKIGEYSDAAPENCWQVSAVITPGDIWDTIRIGYPHILLISAIARQIIQATSAGDGGQGKIGRGGQRVEKLHWEESRVNWREGERQGGYWRREVWEGVPSFKAKQSPHRQIVAQQRVIKVSRPPAVKLHSGAYRVQSSSILALTASKWDLPHQLQLPKTLRKGVSSHSKNERSHRTHITCLLWDSLVGKSLVW